MLEDRSSNEHKTLLHMEASIKDKVAISIRCTPLTKPNQTSYCPVDMITVEQQLVPRHFSPNFVE